MAGTGLEVTNSTDSRAPEDLQPDRRLLRISCWLVALALGAADAWAARFTMFPDGVAYLDNGDAFWRGDWHNAINAYWSPLYPWVLGSFMKVFRPSMYWEYALVHLVNFLFYVAALVAFEFFLRTFVEQERKRNEENATEIGLPIWAWYAASYSAFIASSLLLISVRFPSGDMAVAAIVYFVGGLILRVRAGQAGSKTFVLIGLSLGIGYYAKTAMLLMAIPFLAVAIAAEPARSLRLKRGGLALGIFLLIVSPYILVLSLAKGRPTFGDSGKINYEINVGTVQFFMPNEPGQLHPIRRIAPFREAYEYGSPVGGTYPLWYDPSYWHEGIKPHFEWERQLRTLLITAAQCLWISFNLFLGLGISVGILFLYLVAPSISRCLRYAGHYWPLWIPALAGVGLYALVVIEPRYVGGLFCVLWIVGLSGVRLPAGVASRRLITTAAVAVAVMTCVIVGWQTSRAARGIDIGEKHIATPDAWKAAEALRAQGIERGDKIAVVGPWLVPSQEASYVARLARVRIVAEARPEEYFEGSNRIQLDTAFAKAGAKAILTFGRAPDASGWTQLADTDYYARFQPDALAPPAQ